MHKLSVGATKVSFFRVMRQNNYTACPLWIYTNNTRYNYCELAIEKWVSDDFGNGKINKE